MREGTAAKNLRELSKIINPSNSRRICLCTDDNHIDELILEGSINSAVKISIEEGVAPVTAYQMATLNTAECYNLKEVGAIAPGYKANFLILDDLEKVKIAKVFKDGKLVAKDGKAKEIEIPKSLIDSITLPSTTTKDLEIKLKTNRVNTIGFIPNKLETKLEIKEVDLIGDTFIPNLEKDLLPLYVIDRFSGELNIGKGIIHGFNLKNGAIGTTISHDSHNIILIGTNIEDIYTCLKELEKNGGGIVYSKDGEVKASLGLEIGGLISSKKPEDILNNLKELHDLVEMKDHSFNPFLALSFVSLPVIPEIKLTSQGLFSTIGFDFINLEAKS